MHKYSDGKILQEGGDKQRQKKRGAIKHHQKQNKKYIDKQVQIWTYSVFKYIWYGIFS